ncbi:MAG: hypothetical protein QF464_19075, partial [Myxococcota bacterium]|nr:hypothetical protein [Myxococcota bacterium]
MLVAVGCSPGPTPTQGEWLGEQVGFHLEDGQLSAWWVQGMYCEGADLSAVGGSTCVRVPTGISTSEAQLQGSSFTAAFGDLTLHGTFVSPEAVEGSWSLSSDNCCTAD